MKVRIYYEDTDCGGIVYHTNYLKYCERARSELIFSFFKQNVFEANSGFVVKDLQAQFLSPARLGDELEIVSKCIEIRSASIKLKQDIFLADKMIFTTNVCLVYLKDKKPAKIPNKFIEIFKKIY